MHNRSGRAAWPHAHRMEGFYSAGLGRSESCAVGAQRLIQITPQIRILVAVEPIDGRKGIDSLAQLCREKLAADPFSGCLFLFRSRSARSISILAYDGQGFWLAVKRLSKGRFRWSPTGQEASSVHLRLRPASLLPSLATAFDAPLWPEASLPSAGACYRALRRLPGQVLHLLEERVFQDAPCPYYPPWRGPMKTAPMSRGA